MLRRKPSAIKLQVEDLAEFTEHCKEKEKQKVKREDLGSKSANDTFAILHAVKEGSKSTTNIQTRMASSSREKFFAHNTLAVLLIAMEGCRVRVETKNESTISGILLHADGFGNLSLSSASITTLRGHCVRAEEMYVKASSVRYVHLPDTADPVKAIEAQLEKGRRPSPSRRKLTKH